MQSAILPNQNGYLALPEVQDFIGFLIQEINAVGGKSKSYHSYTIAQTVKNKD